MRSGLDLWGPSVFMNLSLPPAEFLYISAGDKQHSCWEEFWMNAWRVMGQFGWLIHTYGLVSLIPMNTTHEKAAVRLAQWVTTCLTWWWWDFSLSILPYNFQVSLFQKTFPTLRPFSHTYRHIHRHTAIVFTNLITFLIV